MSGRDYRFRQQTASRQVDPFDGILLVDKPSGPTSHDVVDEIRRRFNLRKVGHGGTLDPQATGLLVILMGKGTKLSESLMRSDRVYDGIMRLGISTDTHDGQGKIVGEGDWSSVTEEQLRKAMEDLTGDIMQTPPMVSAVKKDGVPLYKLARKGKTVERKPKLVHVYTFALVDFTPPTAAFRVKCTKGTYVRTLCADVGDALGCGAHVEALRRTSSGDFDVQNAVTLVDLLAMDREELLKKIIPIQRVVLSS